jgi:pilus assembly protein TadC
MITFFFATVLFMFITWGLFLYRVISKEKRVRKSTVYGFLAVSYISHSLACQMLSLPWVFYFVFSLIFLLIFSLNKKLENKLAENDINKKEKDTNEL